MKKYAVLHEPGDIVTLAGTGFVVLDVERRGSLPDSLFLLALESVGASEFGSSNNYAESDLKKAVDKWLEDMGKRGLDNAKLIPREIDLTTLDGSGCYGKLSVKAAPLTLDEARKYADIIPNAERWCWLATGWSGPSKSDGDLALCVYSHGGWDSLSYCSDSNGIRPALKAPSILFEDSEAGLDLSKIPTDDLLQEIHRRLAEARQAAETSLGFKIPDVVATSVLWYARRKCELAEQPESYLPLLYETELTDYYMRLAINLKGEKQREQRMREARNSAVPGTDI